MTRITDRLDHRLARYLRARIEHDGESGAARMLGASRERIMRAAAQERAPREVAVTVYRGTATHLTGLGLLAPGATTEELHAAALAWADLVLAEREGRT